MQLPTIHGIIDRRILVNFRVDPEVLAKVVPAPFRPQIVSGYGVAGICLIRLSQMRPRGFPGWIGFGSENAAHRIAVEWDEAGTLKRGVFVPRRDTSSRWNALVGGRMFPGFHHRSQFLVRETENEYSVEISSADGLRMSVAGRITDSVPTGSVFQSLAAASEFFSQGAVGYSPRKNAGEFEGLELHTDVWNMTALDVRQVTSSWFSNPDQFPPGSIAFDSAFLMRNIPHEWHGLGQITAESTAAACC